MRWSCDLAETLFISVASFCDPMLGFTLRSAFSRAADPSRLRFGIVEQALPGQQLRLQADWAQQQLRWLRVDAAASRGACWARALAMSLWQGEDWFLQVDSHTWFEPDWDTRLLRQARLCAEANPRCILSHYPNAFVWQDGRPLARPAGHQVLAHVLRDGSAFQPGHPVLHFEAVPVASHEPLPGMHLGAGFLLAPGRIVQDLPYDPFLYFHGEEQALALRAWTHGWDIFHPPGTPLYHLYHLAGQEPRPMHWGPGWPTGVARRVDWQALARAAERRLQALLGAADGPHPGEAAGAGGAEGGAEGGAAGGADRGPSDLGVYGLGRQRTLDDYARFSGIDYRQRCLHPHAGKSRFAAGPGAWVQSGA